MSTKRFLGIVWFSAYFFSPRLNAQFPLSPTLAARDENRLFTPDRASGSPFAASLTTASGEPSIVVQMPEQSPTRPVSGVVSLRELEHPVAKKAIQQAWEAQRLARANNLVKAIAKLEKAIRIDPSYRDGHLNLGVQYARLGRIADARFQFKKALEIGPPTASIYLDLAVASLAGREYREAETYARKVLELDPTHSLAQRALEFASTH